MKKKVFLISVDTEGDNLWDWQPDKEITTQNAKYLYRFQSLCDKYNFKPTYLTNYEMAADDYFVDFAIKNAERKACEIGMHLHAWNQPPFYRIDERNDGIKSGFPYLIEYPSEIMEEKIAHLTQFLEERFNVRPIVHRAGRWAMDDRYFKLLDKYGYAADCSVTPGVDWSKCFGFTNGSKGADYSNFPVKPYQIKDTSLMEIPVSIIKDHRVKKDNNKSFKHKIGNRLRAIKGYGHIWLRPNGKNLDDMMYLVDCNVASNNKYLMFMLHSSELMPGGSWTFNDEEKIEKLYSNLETLFEYINRNYIGMTIGDFANTLKSQR